MSQVNLDTLFSRNIELINGNEITLYQSVIGDVGCVVWDAALVLISYFVKCASTDSSPPSQTQVQFEGKNVLEVGSGTGAVGLATASLGARTVVTDMPDFVPLMQHNINMNRAKLKGCCSARTLVWGDEEQMKALKELDFPNGADFIVLADCVYYKESLEHLVQTIRHFSSEHTIVFCSYEQRDSGNKSELQQRFFQMMGKYFEASEVPLSSQDPYYSSSDIHVFNFNLKCNASLI